MCFLISFSSITLQCVRSQYSGEGISAGPNLKMSFAGDEIKLDIPDGGITLPSGWSLKTLENPKVNKPLQNPIFFPLLVSFCFFPLPTLYLLHSSLSSDFTLSSTVAA